jgi:hypothetical protein
MPRLKEGMWVAGEREGYRMEERADFASDHVPGANLESFITVSSSPPEAAPTGVGVIDLRDVARCQSWDPEP